MPTWLGWLISAVAVAGGWVVYRARVITARQAAKAPQGLPRADAQSRLYRLTLGLLFFVPMFLVGAALGLGWERWLIAALILVALGFMLPASVDAFRAVSRVHAEASTRAVNIAHQAQEEQLHGSPDDLEGTPTQEQEGHE